MIKELYKEITNEISLSISQSKIDSIIKKSITTHTYILSFADFQKITLYEKLIF